MLSTRLGYGRPAALARALAWVFCAADSGLDVLAGLDFFQGAVLLLAGFLAAVLLLVAFLAATFLVAPFRTLLCCVARLLVAFFAVPLRGVARFFAAVRAPLFDVAALASVFAAFFFLEDDFVLAAFWVAAPVCLLSPACRRACSRSAHRCPASPPHSSQAM
ncbi:hypothetical protein ABQE73_06980 [Xanthomonas campestris pv. campestris]|nr:hypothetical protein [Xanthomonas campestris]MEB1049484.1 hypothetical protein [Xanthomonas campestris pv. campestris]